MYKRKFTYKAQDVDCKFCTEYRGKNKCPHSVCPYITERIEAGAVSYQDAIAAMVPSSCKMARRLPKLIDEYQDSFWTDDRHKQGSLKSKRRSANSGKRKKYKLAAGVRCSR